MQQVLIEEHPQVDIAIIIVWIDMLAGDTEDAANSSAKIFRDRQVLQFHDPNQHLGKMIAESFGLSNAIAWDAYLFYDKGSEWKEHLSTPLDWAHQLDDPWADQDHYAWGDHLTARLREIVNKLLANATSLDLY